MSSSLIESLMPCPTSWKLDWQGVDDAFSWIRDLNGSTQDIRHHGEGDVGIHTRMVVEELVQSADWQACDHQDQLILFAAALLHDVAKPLTREAHPDGSITNRAHSRIGAVMARDILWHLDFPFALREQVCALIAHHQAPFWLIERPEWQSRQILCQVSLTTSNRLLRILAAADARGRICADRQSIIDNVELFAAAADELGCMNQPFPFASDNDRVRYFRDPEARRADDAVFDTTEAEFVVTMTSGLPGSGKSTWVQEATGRNGELAGQPVISLDHLRSELRIDPKDNQGPVAQAAKEKAREILRTRRSFVWEATSLSREIRCMVLPLFHSYGARVRIVYVEAPANEAAKRNRGREDWVPEKDLTRMRRRWEVPTFSECHGLDYRVEAPTPVLRRSFQAGR